jgi:hypothetical protein
VPFKVSRQLAIELAIFYGLNFKKLKISPPLEPALAYDMLCACVSREMTLGCLASCKGLHAVSAFVFVRTPFEDRWKRRMEEEA